MSRKVLVCILLSLVPDLAGANIALPKQPPPPAGDVFLEAGTAHGLRVDGEVLLLDLTGREGALSRARYRIANPGAAVVTDLFFLTPFMTEVVVSCDGVIRPAETVSLSRGQVPWRTESDGYRWWPKDARIDTKKFTVTFPAGGTVEIEVTFHLPAGYDNTFARGPDAAAVGHALNWSRSGGRAAWYLYSLESVNTFPGGLGELSLEILTPAGTELRTNLTLTGRKVEGDVIRSSGVFPDLPVPSIEARVIAREDYNLFGGEFAIGLATNYVDYTEFMTQALACVFFGSHQFSAGLEANPFGAEANLRLPALYTLILTGTNNEGGGLYGDLRVTAGFLCELLPEFAAGLRVGVGVRLLMMIFEIDYDFYPFDADHGYVGRMTFLYKISI